MLVDERTPCAAHSMTKPPSSAPKASDAASALDSRYELLDLLGRGGMASVYRARERVGGREVALKLLMAASGERKKALLGNSFAREFHTLAQLRHPHVIEVYDYGLAGDAAPYYTMELLDGGDLRQLTPVPWERACALFFEVCSSLALLHSRRLVHRDITPVNVRCTRDGRAKLIDFGAMVGMGTGGSAVVGTPAFVAPETLHRLAPDARTDLFSLGATLYFALTGETPYPARTFADVETAWSTRVRPPSELVPDIPAGLDDLVLSLISVEPALRPASAFDVMQQLAALGGLTPDESEAVSRSYLATPSLVGCDAPLNELRQTLLTARLSRGKALLIEGPPGIGRSRFLDACTLEAKTLDFTVLRATALDEQRLLSSIQDIAQQLLETGHSFEDAPAWLWDTSEPNAARPKLSDLSDVLRTVNADELHAQLVRLLRGACKQRPLLIAIDDVHRIDPRSAAVLAELLDSRARPRLCALLTADSEARASTALQALARDSTPLTLAPLDEAQTRALLSSVFGEVPNLELLAREVYAITRGVPDQCMAVAQHLVNQGVIRYRAGAWILPGRLTVADLPRNAADATRWRIDRLSPNARLLAQALALSFMERLSHAQCCALLPEADPSQIDSALAELITSGAVQHLGSEYGLVNRLWLEAVTATLDERQLVARHQTLAAMYQQCCQVAFIFHAFAGGMDELGLQALSQLNAGYAKQLDVTNVLNDRVDKMMSCYPRALASAVRLGKSPRFVNDLRRWNFAGDVLLEDAGVPASAQAWLHQLRHDTGLDLYEADPDHTDAMQRLMRALQGAQARYLATPEAERVYSVEEALPLLAEYVVIGIAFGGRTHDAALLRSLQPLLEPFAPLAPVLDAIWHNAKATYLGQGEGRYQAAHLAWIEVFAKLEALDRQAMPFVAAIASAVAFAIGLMEAQLGIPTATDWADRLDRDPSQRIAALQLRRIARLEQGDARGAERIRRQAELLALQGRAPQMFKSLLAVELTACVVARDLAGVRDVIEHMRPLAARFPGWVPNLEYAQACFHLVRGDYQAAREQCLATIASTSPEPGKPGDHQLMWNASMLCLAEASLALGNPTEARHTLDQLLAAHGTLSEQERPMELARVIALTDAKLGMPGAVAQLEAAIEQQRRLGLSGPRVGLMYEARALIAIWQGDAEAYERYAALTAHEYRYGAGSPLGARYDRLLNEARRSGLLKASAPATLADVEHATSALLTRELESAVELSMAQEVSLDGRARAALQLLCAAREVRAGLLYLCDAAGLRLAASVGELSPPPDIDELEAFLQRAKARVQELDEMVTGELDTDIESQKTHVRVGDAQAELLPLSCVVKGEPRFAGVVVLAHSQRQLDELRERYLLGSLSSYLLSAQG
jgi:serine/threonine protein kinase